MTVKAILSRKGDAVITIKPTVPLCDAVKILDDFGAALIPPHFGAGYFLPVFQRERVGQIGIGIGFRLIIVGRSGDARIHSGPQGGDVQLVEHLLCLGMVWMVFEEFE